MSLEFSHRPEAISSTPRADQAHFCCKHLPCFKLSLSWGWRHNILFSGANSQDTNFLYYKALTYEELSWISVFIDTQNFQCNEAMFEAVEQQDLDAVQILLYQYTLEELDLNTPNSEGLTPLDIAILTNNVPIARTLLHVGAKESPHCK